MNFLLDENMPPSLALMLVELGFPTRHVNDVGYNNTSDLKIAEFAASSGEVVITYDTDFGTILALSGQNRPSVILFRWQKITAKTLFDFLETNLSQLLDSLENGAFIVVDEHKIRIRKLPIFGFQK